MLGSGLGAFADELQTPRRNSLRRDSRLAASTAVGHAGKLVVGKLDGVDVAVMAGPRASVRRLHARQQVAFGVRVLGALGVRSMVFTNAAGGINLAYRARRAGADFRSHQPAGRRIR